MDSDSTNLSRASAPRATAKHHTSSQENPNFPTGSSGLVAVDKIGNHVLFLDPESLETRLTLYGFAPRVHELTVSADHATAYVPIYGDGIHGKNPNPGHLVAVFNLKDRRHEGDISVYPFLAPHGLRWGKNGALWCVCENSGVVLELDVAHGQIKRVIEVGSNKAHRIEITPDGRKLYTENEEDQFSSVIDLEAGRRIKKIPAPNGLAGLGISRDGGTVVLVDAKQPIIHVVNTKSDEITRSITLEGHAKAAQIARYSPDGRFLVVTSYDAPLGTIFDAELKTQKLLQLGHGPMNMAFTADGRRVVIANHDEGSLALVDLEQGEVLRTVPAGAGIETLSYF